VLGKIIKIPNFIRQNIIKIYYRIFKIPTLKQEMLLRLALKEKGFSLGKLDIQCNHNLGLNYVNGIQFGIKYPESFFNKSQKLIPSKKKYSFYFNGNMSAEGERDTLIKPFKKVLNSLIIHSNDGRVVKNKDKFNSQYFELFANSKYGLCPHQMNWKGDLDELWTYRFIESCFVESIPILFRKTPLSDKFVNNFYFLWDDEVLDMLKNKSNLELKAKAKANSYLAKK
jgi:hypothetical protein